MPGRARFRPAYGVATTSLRTSRRFCGCGEDGGGKGKGPVGLRLGLWRRAPDSVCTPSERKRIYEVFLKAGTSSEVEAFAFADRVMSDQ